MYMSHPFANPHSFGVINHRDVVTTATGRPRLARLEKVKLAIKMLLVLVALVALLETRGLTPLLVVAPLP